MRVKEEIHIQIKQAKLFEEGDVENNDEWTELNSTTYDQVDSTRNIMYLDNVIVDPSYTVTGKLSPILQCSDSKNHQSKRRFVYERNKLHIWFEKIATASLSFHLKHEYCREQYFPLK